MVLFAGLVKSAISRITRRISGRKSPSTGNPRCSSTESLRESTLRDYKLNVKFLGSSLVALEYEDHSILDAHADEKKGTERVCLTLSREYICTSKKSGKTTHMHSMGKVTRFFVHPQKPRVFGYMVPNPESGTVQLLCFRTPKKSRTDGKQVQSAWLKIRQSQCSVHASPSSTSAAAGEVTPPTNEKNAAELTAILPSLSNEETTPPRPATGKIVATTTTPSLPKRVPKRVAPPIPAKKRAVSTITTPPPSPLPSLPKEAAGETTSPGEISRKSTTELTSPRSLPFLPKEEATPISTTGEVVPTTTAPSLPSLPKRVPKRIAPPIPAKRRAASTIITPPPSPLPSIPKEAAAEITAPVETNRKSANELTSPRSLPSLPKEEATTSIPATGKIVATTTAPTAPSLPKVVPKRVTPPVPAKRKSTGTITLPPITPRPSLSKIHSQEVTKLQQLQKNVILELTALQKQKVERQSGHSASPTHI